MVYCEDCDHCRLSCFAQDLSQRALFNPPPLFSEPSIAHDIEPNNSVVNVTKAKGRKQRRVHLDAETIKMLSNYVSTLQLPPMISLSLPSNSGRCGTSSSAMVQSSERTSIRTPSEIHKRSIVCEMGWTSGGCSR